MHGGRTDKGRHKFLPFACLDPREEIAGGWHGGQSPL